jgi:DNA-binding response OmpR family regulator
MRLLIVEDEKKVASFIVRGFQQEGYAVDEAYDGDTGASLAIHFDYDAVVLDVMLPKRSGFDVIGGIRAKKPTLPVIMLTAKDDVDSRIAGLNSGADDYMVKPFAFAELSARVRALLRRGSQKNTKLTVADLELDTATRIVKRANRRLQLTLKEYALLEFLMRRVDRPAARSTILEHVWDLNHETLSNVVDVHVKSLRDKVDKDFSVPLIHTIRGLGYMLSAEAHSAD